MIDYSMLTKQQQAAVNLIRNDLRFMATVFMNQKEVNANCVCAFMPYMRLIIDGVEDWVTRFNNSNRIKLKLPVFTTAEKTHYEQMRETIKFWESPYLSIYEKLGQAYSESDEYFANCCKPIAKALKLYDVFGIDVINKKCCGNTILYGCYIPNYVYSDDDTLGERLYTLSVIGGKYISLFDVVEPYPISRSIDMITQDYGGLIKSPVGNTYCDKFVLFTMLGQVNYILQFIDKFIVPETTTKLRLAYLLYYDVISILPEINLKLSTPFSMEVKWKSELFRNAMAHYGIGVALRKESEIIEGDPLYGLTQKFFSIDYQSLKRIIIANLASLSQQLEKYLKVDKGLFHF